MGNSSSNVLKSVTFSKDEDGSSAKRFREKRIHLENQIEGSVSLTSDENTYLLELCDIAKFGFRARGTEHSIPLTLNQKPIDTVISVGGYEVFRGASRIVNETSSEGSISFGFSILEGMIDQDTVESVLDGAAFKPLISTTNNLLASFDKVNPDFKIAVADLCAVMKDIESKFEKEEFRKDTSLKNKNQERYEQTLIDLAMAVYAPILARMFLSFEDIIGNFNADENHLHKQYFRSVFSDLVKGTPFFSRAFEKPLGYAGDYGLMVMFYKYSDIGDSLFHKFMHRWACNQPAAVANKNRVEFLSEYLSSEFNKIESPAFKVTSIACGPAQEMSLFLDKCGGEAKSNITINLLDQEPKALNFAQANVRQFSQKNFQLKVNAFEEDVVIGSIKKRPFTNEIQDSDVIVSAGLFDYLSDRVASKLIECLFGFLKPGGVLLVGNVSTNNPDRFAMDYLMEWNLILRSKEALLSLVSKNIFAANAEVEVVSEALGLNLFLVIRKKRPNP